MNHQILVNALSKSFRTEQGVTPAFSDINLSIPQGQFCAIVGPSGCGKTSLLRVLAGLEQPTQGEFRIQPSGQNPLSISMVFQQEDLLPWMSLKKNIRFFLGESVEGAERDALSLRFLELVGLKAFAHHYPGEISGGMKQRVSLARAFATRPDLLLMDEPFVFLDYQSRLVLHELLLDIRSKTQNTVLFVTHDIEEAVYLADRVLVMSAHPGRIIQDVSIDFSRPRKLALLRKDHRYVDTVNQLTDWIQQEMKQQFA